MDGQLTVIHAGLRLPTYRIGSQHMTQRLSIQPMYHRRRRLRSANT